MDDLRELDSVCLHQLKVNYTLIKLVQDYISQKMSSSYQKLLKENIHSHEMFKYSKTKLPFIKNKIEILIFI